MYDVVVIVDDDNALADAFATAFLARERQERVAVVLPRSPAFHRYVRRLADHLSSSEITLIEGTPQREDDHYMDVDGRLVYGERIIDAHESLGGAPAALVA